MLIIQQTLNHFDFAIASISTGYWQMANFYGIFATSPDYQKSGKLGETQTLPASPYSLGHPMWQTVDVTM
jgi:hypothetical protein